MTQSRTILSDHLDIKVDVLAYPFGTARAFTKQTQRLAQEAGYRAAFSYYGGANEQATMQHYDLKRVQIAKQSLARFRVQTGICRLTGSFWP